MPWQSWSRASESLRLSWATARPGYQKSERRIKELQFQQDEDRKNQDRMSELAQKL